MKDRLEKHIEKREMDHLQYRFISESSWRFLLWGFLIGAKEVKQLTPEEAIKVFFKGKELPLQETTLQALLEKWEEFTKTSLYKIYSSENHGSNISKPSSGPSI